MKSQSQKQFATIVRVVKDMTESTRINEITARAAIEEGRIEITDDDTDADMYVKQKWRDKPLSGSETHLTLHIHTENGTVEVGLDSKQMDALADAVYHVQEAYND